MSTISSSGEKTENRLWILFSAFLRISAVSVGGGLTMLPLMSREFVEKRDWMSEEDMVDVVAVVQSVPGIIAFNMAVMIGYRSAGFAGALAATLGVAIPPFLAIVVVASCFLHLQQVKLVADIFTGVRAAVAALILVSVLKMSRSIFKEKTAIVLAALSLAALLFFQINAILLIILAAFTGLSLAAIRTNGRFNASAILLAAGGAGSAGAAAGAAGAIGMTSLFLLFAKIGIFTFGGGYAMVPLFQDELVNNYHFLTGSEFANLVSLAQVTPGPIGLNAATYIGYQCGAAAGGFFSALWGAAVGTFGVMVPSLAVVTWIAAFMKAYKGNRIIQAILSGIRPATLGLIAYAVVFFLETSAFTAPVLNLWTAGKSFGLCWQGCVLFVLALFLELKWKLNMIWLLLGTAGLSALLFLI